MSSSRFKKVLLLLGILIAVIIGINAYAGATPEPVMDHTISLIEKLKSVTDFDPIIRIVKFK